MMKTPVGFVAVKQDKDVRQLRSLHLAKWRCALPPNKNATHLRNLGEFGDTLVSIWLPESPEASPVRMHGAVSLGAVSAPSKEEYHTFIDHDGEAGMWVEWRQEIYNAFPDECDPTWHPAYLALPYGKFPRDAAAR